MNPVQKLMRIVEENAVITNLRITDDRLTELLNQRDQQEFSTKWMEAFQRIVGTQTNGVNDIPHPDEVLKLRELCYLQAYRRWKSADLAAYISDDMGLVGDALLVNATDPWINALLREYLSGRFPTGRLAELDGDLSKQLG